MASAALGDVTGLPDTMRGDGIDDWDPEHIRRTLPVLNALFRSYFRAEVRGLQNVPADRPVLLVGNHSGGLVIVDTFVFTMAFYERFGAERRFHQLAHDFTARFPGMGGFRRYGMVRASHETARRAFRLGAPVLVYPGGDYETFRPSWRTDRIEFGGRSGFARLALDEGVPIVPVVSIGGQETALFVTRAQRLARLLRLDDLLRVKVFPVSLGPPFGLNVFDLPGRLPLPAKITIQVLPAIDPRAEYGTSGHPDEVYDDVTTEMQQALAALAQERTLPVIG